MRLIPINIGQGQIQYMTEADAIAQGYLNDPTLGIFGSRKRKRTEQKVSQASQAAQQNTTLLNNVAQQLQQTIPGLQKELQRVNAELQREVNRRGAAGKANNTLGYLALGVAGVGTAISLYNKFANQND